MKLTKKQLEQIGFIFVTLNSGIITLNLKGKTLDDTLFHSRAKTEKTLIKRANQWLNEQYWIMNDRIVLFSDTEILLTEYPDAIFAGESGLKISYNVQSEELYRVK